MTNSKHTKRALLASVLSVVVCAAMLVGSTFAWFTDSVTSAGNIIKSGNLKVALEWANGTEALDTATWQDASTGAIFNYDLWEPGYTEVRHVRISNKGNLALKYEIRIVANGEVSKLAEAIDVYYVKDGKQLTSRNDLTDTMKIGTLKEVLANPYAAKGHILAGENAADVATIALKMQEDAGNEYQGLSIGTDFSVQLVATQYTHEGDSFDDQYDKDAKYPALVSTPDGFKTALTEGGEITLADNVEITDGIQLYVKQDTALSFNGNTFKGSLYNGDFSSGSPSVNLVLSDPNNTGNYSIDGKLVRHEGGGMTQTAAIAVWQPTVTIESGKYTHDNAVINCQLQTQDPDAVGVIVNGGTFDGKGNASVIANDFGTVIINDGTFNAYKEGDGSGECVYVSYGNSYVPSATVINNGTFNAESRIFYINRNDRYEQKLEVKGGNYTVAEGGKLVEVKDGASAKDILVITGGTFNVDPTEYVDTANYKVTQSGGLCTVTAK